MSSFWRVEDNLRQNLKFLVQISTKLVLCTILFNGIDQSLKSCTTWHLSNLIINHEYGSRRNLKITEWEKVLLSLEANLVTKIPCCYHKTQQILTHYNKGQKIAKLRYANRNENMPHYKSVFLYRI